MRLECFDRVAAVRPLGSVFNTRAGNVAARGRRFRSAFVLVFATAAMALNVSTARAQCSPGDPTRLLYPLDGTYAPVDVKVLDLEEDAKDALTQVLAGLSLNEMQVILTEGYEAEENRQDGYH